MHKKNEGFPFILPLSYQNMQFAVMSDFEHVFMLKTLHEETFIFSLLCWLESHRSLSLLLLFIHMYYVFLFLSAG